MLAKSQVNTVNIVVYRKSFDYSALLGIKVFRNVRRETLKLIKLWNSLHTLTYLQMYDLLRISSIALVLLGLLLAFCGHVRPNIVPNLGIFLSSHGNIVTIKQNVLKIRKIQK